jgi:hypothetical protein
VIHIPAPAITRSGLNAFGKFRIEVRRLDRLEDRLVLRFDVVLDLVPDFLEPLAGLALAPDLLLRHVGVDDLGDEVAGDQRAEVGVELGLVEHRRLRGLGQRGNLPLPPRREEEIRLLEIEDASIFLPAPRLAQPVGRIALELVLGFLGGLAFSAIRYLISSGEPALRAGRVELLAVAREDRSRSRSARCSAARRSRPRWPVP